ncbi:MAG: response regulator [Epsilonproteobacteria bacterium]|nr:MAG: response regulator [Campylobacterota bacterium]
MENIDDIIKYSSDLKLLYVEDDLIARESIKIILEEFFKKIIVAVDGMDGLEKYRDNSVDLIITDINMPKLNGLKMIEKIREKDKDTPIMILSAYTESEYLNIGTKLGIGGYLLKPFDLDQFVSTLDNVLRNRTEITTKQ